MKLHMFNLITLGTSLASWLCARLGYTVLPTTWDDKPFWIGFLLYVAALVMSGIALVRAFAYAGQTSVAWWQGTLMVVWAIAQGLLALFLFVLLYAEGMQGYEDR